MHGALPSEMTTVTQCHTEGLWRHTRSHPESHLLSVQQPSLQSVQDQPWPATSMQAGSDLQLDHL